MKMSSEAIKANMKAMREGRSIVPINEDGLNIPIFSINSYTKMKDLSSSLGNDQPFYGFTPAPVNLPPEEDIHEKASMYLNEIKTIKPEGPYILSAICNTHPVIFEIAQKLQDQGDDVPIIILYEAYRPIALSPNNSIDYQIRRLKSNYNQLRDLSPTNRIKFMYDIFHRKINKLNFLKKNKKSEKQIVQKSRSKGNNQDLIKNYQGNVVVFKASKSIINYNNYPLLGWKEFVNGDLKIITIEGYHLQILEKPRVVNLANELSKVLKEFNKN